MAFRQHGSGVPCDNVDLVLVSDAGAPFEIEESPWEDNVLQLGRVRDILIDQTRALRKRWLVQEFIDKRKLGAYWGIGTRIDKYDAPSPLTKDNDTTTRLEAIPTRLREFSAQDQGTSSTGAMPELMLPCARGPL